MDDEWLARRFEGNRARLRAMAYRMLGSPSDAEDAVQEAWIHVAGADADEVANLDGWFTTIVARVCLDMLRSRKSRHEEPVSDIGDSPADGPEQEAVLADSVGIALLIVLDRLAPAERVAFVLHDMFGVPFGDIAGITGRSADAARQLASRARRRVRGEDYVPPGDQDAGERLSRQRAVADAFLSAARSGDLAGLLAVLDPDVVLRGDEAAVAPGYPRELRGAEAVGAGARSSAARSRRSFVALVDGVPGIVWAPRGRAAVVLAFTYAGDKISGIEVIGDQAHIESLNLALPA